VPLPHTYSAAGAPTNGTGYYRSHAARRQMAGNVDGLAAPVTPLTCRPQGRSSSWQLGRQSDESTCAAALGDERGAGEIEQHEQNASDRLGHRRLLVAARPVVRSQTMLDF